MKFQTFSIVTGTMACDAKCPYCISGLTNQQGLTMKKPAINWRNFDIACRLAEKAGVTTAMLTGKGETTFAAEGTLAAFAGGVAVVVAFLSTDSDTDTLCCPSVNSLGCSASFFCLSCTAQSAMRD